MRRENWRERAFGCDALIWPALLAFWSPVHATHWPLCRDGRLVPGQSHALRTRLKPPESNTECRYLAGISQKRACRRKSIVIERQSASRRVVIWAKKP